MTEILKDGGKLFIRTIFINIMCFFVVVSLISFAVAVFAEDVGYVAYGTTDKESEGEKLYTYYIADGEDTKLKEYEEQGYTVTTRAIREVNKTGDTVILLVAQAFALGILITFIYPSMWDRGNSDSNLVNFEHQKKDTLKGLKIGTVAATPSILLFLVLVITRSGLAKNVPVALYKLLNASFYPIIEFIVGDSTKFAELNALQLILLALTLLAVPVIAFIGYYFGYKGLSIGEKLTYKKTK